MIVKMFSKLGLLVAGLIGICFVVVMIPFIAAGLLSVGAHAGYTNLWARIRRDPKAKLEIPGLWGDEQLPANKQELVKEFERLSTLLAGMGSAKKGKPRYEDLEIFDKPLPKDFKSTTLKLSQTLATKHAELLLTTTTEAYVTDEGKLRLETGEEDDCPDCGSEVEIKVRKPKLQVQRDFNVNSSEDAWMAIALLRGDTRLTEREGQLWAYIPEHKVWLVEYKPNSSNYGLRRAFTGAFARKYRRDWAAAAAPHNTKAS